MTNAQARSFEELNPTMRPSGIVPRSEQGEEEPHEALVLADLQARVAALCEDGAEAVDAVGMQHAKRLMQRMQALPQAAQPILCRWLHTHLQHLQARLESDREQAEQEARRLCELGFLPSSVGRDLVAKGKYQRLRQLARRYPEEAPRLREQLHAQWRAALDAEAQKRGLSSPGMLDAPVDDEQEVRSPAELATALYRDTAATALATLTIAKAVDALPEDAGRYHAATVATRALQAMQAVPSYLKAQLERLECLAAMESLATPTEPVASQEARGKKRRPKTRKSPSTSSHENLNAAEDVLG